MAGRLQEAIWHSFCLVALLLFTSQSGPAVTLSPLSARGYTVIPEPQKVALGRGDFRFGEGWRLELGRGIQANDVAVESLKEDLQSRFHVILGPQAGRGARTKTIRLAINPNSVEIGDATDRDRKALAEQAYKMVLTPDNVTITANAAAGLFYGVQTLIQLVKPKEGNQWLPEGQIVDWPDLELRVIFWDNGDHLEHLDALKHAVRQAAFFKINGFAWRPEGHFQYQSARAMVDPYALSPGELQELTDYSLRYHLQLIPYLDGPAHDAFILKHPEYAKLREYPESNYEFCVTNPDTYRLFFGMYQELIDANKGGTYFLTSTDEPWYVGLAKNPQCNEVDRAGELGSVGKLLAEFTTKTADYLHDRGRTVIFWGEYPLKPDDISALPHYLVNGEVYGPDFDPVFKRHGIRQIIYTPTHGEEPLFPSYYILPASERLHPIYSDRDPVRAMFDHISFTTARQQADLMGVFVAAWDDAGLHPETFWLGFATGPAAGWHPGSPDPRESMNAFYPLFYGPSATNMGRVYQLMSLEAQFWADSWETTPSARRKPMFGNSYGIFIPPRPARDETLPLPPIPSPPYLTPGWDWTHDNADRLRLTAKFLAENDELLDLLHLNLQRVEFNRYNLEVFLSIARLYRQNLIMLQSLGRIDALLKSAQAAAKREETRQAVTALDGALNTVEMIREQRNQALQDATATWYQSWFPRVLEANGRRFLNEMDDVQDPRAVRTVDMSYLVYRELILPVQEWAESLQRVRNQYAELHDLPVRNEKFDWKDTQTMISQEGASQ